MKHLVSPTSVLLIKVMLSDPKISEKVMENIDDKDKYKIITIQENGNIVLGKTSIRWWNQLIHCQDTIPFESFALRTWDALVDLSNGMNNRAILEGLSKEIAIKAQRESEYDWVVNRLFDVARHVSQECQLYQTVASPEGDLGKSGPREVIVNRVQAPDTIVLNINGVPKKTLHFKDSIGDPFIDLELGVTDIRVRNGY